MSDSKIIDLVTLGCFKNLTDSEYLVHRLSEAGHKIGVGESHADVVLINTCGFIKPAKEESIDAVSRAVRRKKCGGVKKIVVAGCLVERYAREILEEVPEVDALLRIKDYPDAAGLIKSMFNGNGPSLRPKPRRDVLYSGYEKRVLLTPKHFAFLKISDGCDHKCGFCVIPGIRGRYRSRNIKELTAEVKMLGNKGVKEIILIAQDTTAYGRDLNGKNDLALLLRSLVGIKKIEWIRILYAFPTSLTEEMMRIIAGEEKICKYLDIPFQHASDKILRLMRRGYTNKKIRALIQRARKLIPGVTIRTAFIVGHPQESKEDFKMLEDLVRECRFERMGAFCYSDEEASFSFGLKGKVPERTKKSRFGRIMSLQQKVSHKKNELMIGRQVRVLLDEALNGKRDGIGRTEGDAPEVDGSVHVSGTDLRAGEFYNVKVTDAYEYDLVGKVCG